MLLTAIIHREEDWYVAECPEVGTASQGKTVEEAIANLREATEVYLEEFPQSPSSNLIVATFEVPAHA
ncbi:MAG: type II toxin-antitoxin system HicB family antitoxin [Candidatus Sumerlaeota bacterium]|nr:type II toxin-antitoxin system HicB family antitoxin [Candidatus Sumerlaeota bacterium]